MIAALPMYDWPEAQLVNDRFWTAVADRFSVNGIEAPATLTRGRAPENIWTDPDLLLAQTGGLPLLAGRCGDAVCIARPDYRVEGAGEGLYSSALICRRGDARPLERFRGARAAINGYGSQSGCNALADALPGERQDFFASVAVSGSHRASARMVADGAADLAAIDAVAWALFAGHEREAFGRLEVVAWTRPMPALPFITAPSRAGHAADLVAALDAACASVTGPGVPRGVAAAGIADYEPVRAMAQGLRGLRLAPGARRL